MAPSDTRALIEDIAKIGETYDKNDAGSRAKLLELSYALAASVELPSQAIQRIGWAEPARSALCKVALDLSIFETLKDHDGRSLSSQELASMKGAHPTLICPYTRVMKHLSAMNIVQETAPDSYTSTSLSRALTEPKYRDGLIYTYDVAGPSFRSMPTYLKSISYDHPTNILDGPFQYAHKTEVPFFGWLAQNPPYGGLFASYMGGYRAGMPFWADEGFYPFEKQLLNGFEGNSTLLVDVGGGDGHDLLELLSKKGELPGKLVLQDQDSVISKVTEAGVKGFEATTHDFFTEQPIKGARAYYLHSVFHDWDDESCRKILRQIVSAMKKDYSKLLVNELVVPNKNASWGTTSMDWLMMALGAVKERTENDWRALLESVGLKVSNIWECPFDRSTEALIEAELA